MAPSKAPVKVEDLVQDLQVGLQGQVLRLQPAALPCAAAVTQLAGAQPK